MIDLASPPEQLPEWLRVTYTPRNALLSCVVALPDLDAATVKMAEMARTHISDFGTNPEAVKLIAPVGVDVVCEWIAQAFPAITQGAFPESKRRWNGFIDRMRARSKGRKAVVLERSQALEAFAPLIEYKLPPLCGREAVACRARISDEGIMDVIPLGFAESDYRWDDGFEVGEKLT